MRALPVVVAALLAGAASPIFGQSIANTGPYNAAFLQGGIGIERDLLGADASLAAGAGWSLSAWVRPDATRQDAPLITIGGPDAARSLKLRRGTPTAMDGGRSVASSSALRAGEWTHVAAVSDGRQLTLYINGKRAGSISASSAAVAPRLAIAPAAQEGHFGGTLVHASFTPAALSAEAIAAAVRNRPNFDLVQIWRVGVGWEWQKQANTGLWRQQDPWTLPKARGTATRPPAARPAEALPPLTRSADGRWTIHGWQLAAAPEVKEDGAALSRSTRASGTWRAATVPGTVLTTLVDRGVYPHPYYGLNNLGIPESLSRQDYWYRTSFTVPPEAAGKRLTLVFGGINYASEIWANGLRLGTTRGAFIRGQFDFVPVAGENRLAIRVSPPPHPGIPHEQSITAGVGENGGQLAIDGPTFIATEGWDWIPGIRDRNTGLWRPVELLAHGDVRILDPQVITDLPLPRTDTADVYVTVPVENDGTAARQVTVRAAFGTVRVEKTVSAPPGESRVAFTPAEFPALRVRNPKLWWPNGYGEAALYQLSLEALADGQLSDTRTQRFGIREVSYDLSLFDHAGALRRVNVQTTDGKLAGTKLIDVRHEGIKQSPRGWAESLTAAGERSPAVTPVPQQMPEPHLTIRVNGVPIAARGGNWGMDDAMKQVSRDRLAPYFRLQKEAHMNVIRNWMGNNNEDEFFELADENGMMILNDFWQSTQNFQVEPQDPQLFLTNAVDTVKRYRNHPSIVLWFGRNEGVPYPALNEGLDDVIAEHDGTRWFTGSSNVVNLQGSGPYNYRPPVGYFTDLATGFSVETGTPSLSTLESVRASMPDSELWPLSDTLAYHDWHFAGNGDTKTFMQTLATMFGEASSFADFERKAQMMNLETHKAMYEGFLGHLWTKNSGRLLWMTHPAWPSNAWQIYSWDYDTHAAYYGAKKAAEPLHVQLNLPGNELVVLNTTQAAVPGLTARTRVVSLDNRELFTRTDRVDAAANQATTLAAVPLDRIFGGNPMVLVSLQLLDGKDRVVAENFYWRGRDAGSYRALNDLAPVVLEASAAAPVTDGDDRMIAVTLANTSQVPVLNAKLTLVDQRGERILPAYYSDNYAVLLPGERKRIEVRYPASTAATPSLTLRGWNVPQQAVPVAR
ncbi:glycoside hydrolase family 2 [Sphingomonas sp. PL-96]|uniref:glycosyl hydrolase 2 galactose-binding domain-containing protein n=1 Tax=Sphingomonas sp. PL-96 TaxID=2887201 RepID=UPI001E3B5999|nr:LamG-like jellyroll fold domain-containing protein [Sphingomonas sp. PL-96]MCC2975935.1 glycoside hydrolase family 2 [Sphingomonas sp. PL-96]